ncbi:hypothetical protein [Streptomyces sp. NPDC051684]
MIALSDAFLTVLYGALAWTIGAAVLATAAGIALARAIHRRISR